MRKVSYSLLITLAVAVSSFFIGKGCGSKSKYLNPLLKTICEDSTLQEIFRNDDVVILQSSTKSNASPFAPDPIGQDTADLMVENYHKNIKVSKSVYVDFPFNNDVSRVIGACGKNGFVRIYFGAYETKSASKKNSANPKEYLDRATALMLPVKVDAAGNKTEDLNTIVNLGSLCPPECATITNADGTKDYKTGTLAKKAKLKP